MLSVHKSISQAVNQLYLMRITLDSMRLNLCSSTIVTNNLDIRIFISDNGLMLI